MTVKFIPAEEVVTRTVVPAKVVLELTPEEAANYRALLGRCCGVDYSVFTKLTSLAEAGHIPHLVLTADLSSIRKDDFEVYE